jgi:WD40 repeat protein
MYKLSLILFVFFIFTGCATKSHQFIQAQQCPFEDLKINQTNSFCAPPRTTLLEDSKLFIGFDNGAILTWDLDTNKLLHRFTQTDLFPIQHLQLHQQKLYAASRSMQLKKYSLLGELENEVNYEKGSLFCLENSLDHIYVGFGNAELGTLRIDDLELLEIKKDHEYLIYSLYKDGNTLYSGGDDNKLIVWEITSDGSLKKIRSLQNFSSSIRKITKYHSSLFLGLGDGTIIQLDNNFDQTKYETNKTQAPITSLIASEKYLVSGDADGKVILYSLDSHRLKEVESLKLESSIRSIISYEGSYLIFTKQGFIQKIE